MDGRAKRRAALGKKGSGQGRVAGGWGTRDGDGDGKKPNHIPSMFAVACFVVACLSAARGPQEGCGRSSGAIRRKGENLCLSLVHLGREVTFHGPSCCVALEVARTSRCSLSERACTAYFVRHPAKHQGTPQRHHLLREWWPAECLAVLPRCVGDGGTLVNKRERHVSRCRKGILAVTWYRAGSDSETRPEQMWKKIGWPRMDGCENCQGNALLLIHGRNEGEGGAACAAAGYQC